MTSDDRRGERTHRTVGRQLRGCDGRCKETVGEWMKMTKKKKKVIMDDLESIKKDEERKRERR
jgi:predicted Fe-S protein YdhL (DUF1289 family)